jgi:manganese/iron transport system permease protein
MGLGIGAATSFLGAYLSYFLDGATGGIIVVLQTAIFLLAFVFAPKHGMLASRRRLKASLEEPVTHETATGEPVTGSAR